MSLFYQISYEEIEFLHTVLTRTEFSIYTAIRALNPFGDNFSNFSPSKIADTVKASVRTVYRALKKFENLGLIQRRTLQQIKTWTEKCEEYPMANAAKREHQYKTRTTVADQEMSFKSQACRFSDTHDTSATLETQECHERQNQPPEPLPAKSSESPHTNQTYTDFKRSLSDSERERFFDFVKEEIKDFPKKVNDIDGWLADKDRYLEKYAAFKKHLAANGHEESWATDPRTPQWLEVLRKNWKCFIYVKEIEGTKEEKQSFKAWVEKNNLLGGLHHAKIA